MHAWSAKLALHANAHCSSHKVNSACYVHILELHTFMNNLLKVPFLNHSFQKEVIISSLHIRRSKDHSTVQHESA